MKARATKRGQPCNVPGAVHAITEYFDECRAEGTMPQDPISGLLLIDEVHRFNTYSVDNLGQEDGYMHLVKQKDYVDGKVYPPHSYILICRGIHGQWVGGERLLRRHWLLIFRAFEEYAWYNAWRAVCYADYSMGGPFQQEVADLISELLDNRAFKAEISKHGPITAAMYDEFEAMGKTRFEAAGGMTRCMTSLRNGWAGDVKQFELNNEFDNPEAALAKILAAQRYMDPIVRLPFGDGNLLESVNRKKHVPGHTRDNIEVIIGCLNTPGIASSMEDYVLCRQVIGDMLHKTKMTELPTILAGSCRDKVLRLFVLVSEPAK